MPEVDLIIFDLDGTLIDSRKDIAHCVNWTLQDMGLPEIPHDVIYSYVGHGVRALMEGAVKEAHGEDSYDRALRLFDEHYSGHLLDHTILFSGMAEVLEKHKGKAMAVITNKPQKYTDPIIDGLNLRDYFPVVLGRDACQQPKPYPEPIFKTLKELPADKKRTVIIGDTEIDIETGKRAGILTCGALFGFGKAEKVREAEPDIIIEQPKDLMDLF